MMDHHRRIPAICSRCGANFMARVDDIRRGFGHCCSRKCAVAEIRSHAVINTPPASQAEKQRAHGLVNMRQRRGTIIVPNCCQKCGTTGRLDKHHDDYSRPGDVIFLCRSCHMKQHLTKKRQSTSTEVA